MASVSKSEQKDTEEARLVGAFLKDRCSRTKRGGRDSQIRDEFESRMEAVVNAAARDLALDPPKECRFDVLAPLKGKRGHLHNVQYSCVFSITGDGGTEAKIWTKSTPSLTMTEAERKKVREETEQGIEAQFYAFPKSHQSNFRMDSRVYQFAYVSGQTVEKLLESVQGHMKHYFNAQDTIITPKVIVSGDPLAVFFSHTHSPNPTAFQSELTQDGLWENKHDGDSPELTSAITMYHTNISNIMKQKTGDKLTFEKLEVDPENATLTFVDTPNAT